MFIFTVSNSTVLFSMSAVKVHSSTTMKNQNKKENKKRTRILDLLNYICCTAEAAMAGKILVKGKNWRK